MSDINLGKTTPVLLTFHDLSSVGHRSHMIVDAASKTAAVIDPLPDPAPYLDAAARENAQIRHVFLTKLHADFECGHRALMAQTGAVVYTGAWARPDYPYLPVKDGDALHFGATSLRILETPGHTLEGISIIAGDVAGIGAPWGLFPGDLVFPGDIGRPEPRLDDGFHAPQLADMLYASLHHKVLTLPPGTRVYSSHRPAGTGPDAPTLAALRRSTPLLQPMSRAAFVAAATAGMLPAPLTRETRNLLNRSDGRSRPSGNLPRLSRDVFLSKASQGNVVLDLREPMEFAAAHLRGSLNLGLGADFGDWAPALLDPTENHLLITNPGSEAEAAQRLAPLTGGRLRGVLAGGMSALESRPDLLERNGHAGVSEEDPEGRRSPPAERVDVRPAAEADGDSAGRVRRLPLEELLGRLGEVPARRSALAVLDLDPYRAHAAASLLRRRGWPEASPVVAPRVPARSAAGRR